MKKVVRIGTLEGQDEIRRDDLRSMSPNERVEMLLRQQSQYFDWSSNPTIQRVATIREIGRQ